MPRINEAEIDRLKKAVPIADLIESTGVRLERIGAQLVGRCPWHAGGRERTPSLIVTPKKNLWACKGACGVGGSTIDWVMKRDNVAFVRAVEILQAFAPTASTKPKRARPVVHANADAERREYTAVDYANLEEVAAYYAQTFKETPPAIEYAERRGLFTPEVVVHFGLGFSNRTLSKVLPDKHGSAGAKKLLELEALGLLYRGHELMAGSIVVPIQDDEGRVVGMYGRRIRLPADRTPVHRYMPGPHRAVFNAQALAHSDEIICTEAIIDALSFHAAGYHNVISSYGVEGFTPLHLAALKRHNTQRVLIAYDRDAAGERGAELLAEKLTSEGIGCYRVEFPKGMDANEYACRLKPAAKSLGIVLRKAVPMLGAPARTVFPIREPTASPSLASKLIEPMSTPPISDTPNPSATPVPTPLLAAPTAAAPKPVDLSSSSPLLPPVTDVAVEERGDEIFLSIEDRKYRVRGLAKNTSMGSLRINLLVVRGEQYFMDSLDLCLVRPRAQYERLAGAELGVGEDLMHRDVGKVLRKLEELQSAKIQSILEPKNERPEISPEDEAAAMELLKSPDLFQRIESDLEHIGVIGELLNKVLAYVASISRKLEDPLAIVIQSTSAAGKSRLMDKIYECVPPEERMRVSAMTPQALYYLRETELCNKVLVICEEEGAESSSYPLKLLQSEHELVIAVTTKNPESGELQTKERRVRGPVMIFLTTTAIDVDEELLNRALVLTVDENRAQTQAIHRIQRKRETIEGILAGRERLKVVKLHQNAQRLLRPMVVANPYAESLTFADQRTRTRRDHMKYLALIRAIALLRQHQKSTKTVMTELGEVIEYIEVEPADIETANRLLRDVLSRTLSELPPQTERLLGLIVGFVKERAAEKKIPADEVRFTRRELREATGFGNTQLKTHLKRLEDLEHLALRGGRDYRFEYQLLSGESPKWSGVEPTRSGERSKMVGPETADGRGVSGVGRPSFDAVKPLEMQHESPTRSGLEGKEINGIPSNGATNGATNGAHVALVTSSKSRPS